MVNVQKTLLQNEKLLLQTRLHWVVFVPAIVWFMISICLFSICRGWSFFETILFNQPIYIWLSLIALFIAVVHTLRALIKFFVTKYVVTDKRVLMQSGLLRHKHMELFLNKIDSVQMTRTLIGRLFGFGTIVISGASGNKESFPLVTKPMEFRNAIHEQLNK